MAHFTGLLGILVILSIGYAFSAHRRHVKPRTIIVGVALQFVLAFTLLRFPPVVAMFNVFAAGVTQVISFADAGTEFIFGKAADASGPWGFIFAVKVLPIIIYFAALMAVLYGGVVTEDVGQSVKSCMVLVLAVIPQELDALLGVV